VGGVLHSYEVPDTFPWWSVCAEHGAGKTYLTLPRCEDRQWRRPPREHQNGMLSSCSSKQSRQNGVLLVAGYSSPQP
jgi:hypothetical protein